jgi:hypothetical protein
MREGGRRSGEGRTGGVEETLREREDPVGSRKQGTARREQGAERRGTTGQAPSRQHCLTSCTRSSAGLSAAARQGLGCAAQRGLACQASRRGSSGRQRRKRLRRLRRSTPPRHHKSHRCAAYCGLHRVRSRLVSEMACMRGHVRAFPAVLAPTKTTADRPSGHGHLQQQAQQPHRHQQGCRSFAAPHLSGSSGIQGKRQSIQ